MGGREGERPSAQEREITLARSPLNIGERERDQVAN